MVLTAALMFLGCQPGLDENFGVTETDGSVDCDGLLGSHCLMPFPSDYFRVGGALAFGPESLPLQESGEHIDGSWYAGLAGYGVATPILLQWPGLSLDGLPEVFRPEQSLAADSRTVIVNAATGERVPHWAEFDHYTDDLEDPVLILRFADALDPDTRYVVGLRDMVDRDGQTLAVAEGFAALRDETTSTIIGVHQRREHFDTAIFPVLADHGVERDGLQLAWDFTTNTDENSTSLMRQARDAVIGAVPAEGPSIAITSHDYDFGSASIAHRIEGTVEIPSVLLPEDDRGIRLLRRDASGVVEAS